MSDSKKILSRISDLYAELFAGFVLDGPIVMGSRVNYNDLVDSNQNIDPEILLQALALLLSPCLWIQDFVNGCDIPELTLVGVNVDSAEDLVPKFGGAYLNSVNAVKLYTRTQSSPVLFRNLANILFFLSYSFAFFDLDGPQKGVESKGLHFEQFAHLLHPKAMERAQQFGN